MNPNKVIVTNWSAIRAKYDAAGATAIRTAINDLIAADKKRGLETVLIAIDDAAQMKKLRATAVTDKGDFKQNKQAIDGVYQAYIPDYVTILGAVDVIPHQNLRNQLFSPPDGDTDRFAYGDLPYACDAPYSRDIKDFSGPTRCVGRLPDVSGSSDPRYLLGLLKTASKWQGRRRSAYQRYLGISTQSWRRSTALSLMRTFNSDDDLKTCPTEKPEWKTNLISRRMHFINCHGDTIYPNFLGESSRDEEDTPISHMAAFVGRPGKIKEGTVVAAECCYGGELYDPSGEENGQMGICNTYLDRKAYGVFASTTIAYGPPDDNDQADLICQYFLQRVLAGASLGRAALEARQRFVEKVRPLSMTDRKTLAQFNLYGDPSITPVEVPNPKKVLGTKMSKAKTVAAKHRADAAERAERRDLLRAKGTVLAQSQPSVKKSATPKSISSSLGRLMTRMQASPVETISFQVASTPQPKVAAKGNMAKTILRRASKAKPATTAFHVSIGVAKRRTKKRAGKAVRRIVILEAKQIGSNIMVSETRSK